MNNKLLAYVRELTGKDKKTLSEKVAKLFEEGGELAKKSLPYSDAAGTRHRFCTRDAILEEVADVILVALSIGYDLGMDDDDLESYMQEKADYWCKLQLNEENVKANLPFEIHVTVEGSNFDFFKRACHELNVKPLLLKNYSINDGFEEEIMMANAVVTGSTREANQRLSEISLGLRGFGFEVKREKIETVPWHPAAKSLPNDRRWSSNRVETLPEGKSDEYYYFEAHMNVMALDGKEGVDGIVAAVKHLQQDDLFAGAKIGISWNMSKTPVDGVRPYFLTYRETKPEYNNHPPSFEYVASRLSGYSKILSVTREHVEFAIYDTAEKQDKTWLNSIAA